MFERCQKEQKNSKLQLIIKHYLPKTTAQNLNKKIKISSQSVRYQTFLGNLEEKLFFSKPFSIAKKKYVSILHEEKRKEAGKITGQMKESSKKSTFRFYMKKAGRKLEK